MAEEAEEVSEASTPPSTKASEQGEVEPKVEEVVPPKKAYKYNLEFTFDTDVRCAITIMYFATEEISNGQIMYVWLSQNKFFNFSMIVILIHTSVITIDRY